MAIIDIYYSLGESKIGATNVGLSYYSFLKSGSIVNGARSQGYDPPGSEPGGNRIVTFSVAALKLVVAFSSRVVTG
jgi:hypothetical protein